MFQLQQEIDHLLFQEEGQVTFSHGEQVIKEREENDYIISNEITIKHQRLKAIYAKMKQVDRIMEEASHPYKRILEFKESQDYPTQFLNKIREQRQSIQSIKIEGEPVTIIKQLKQPSTP